MRVLYIAGAGRSGTTVLGNALNEVPGYFHAGELQSLWSIAGRPTRHACGCGAEVRECPVWSAVLASPAPGGTTVGGATAAAVGSLERARRPARLAGRLLRPGGPRPFLYERLLAAAYEAVARTTGARVVIDSSKSPAGAASLLRMDALEAFLVHVVRDPRAVAYSWLKPKAHLRRQSVAESTARWVQANRGAEAVARLLPNRSLRIRYEDFVEHPEAALSSILALLGDAGLPLPVEGAALRLGGNHTLIGNPDREAVGIVPLRLDRRWETGLPRWQALTISAAAYPLLRRYGYL